MEVTMESVDPHNIKRGPCFNHNCDCAGYIRASSKIACSYCECPPAKHQRIGDGPFDDSKIIVLAEAPPITNTQLKSKQMSEESAQDKELIILNGSHEKTDTLLSGTTNESVVTEELIVEKKSFQEMSISSNSIDGIDKKSVAACFPVTWPDYIQDIIDGKSKINSTIRCEIIRTLVYQMASRKMNDSAHYIDVAEEALIRIPALKVKSTQSSALLISEMRKCWKNKKQYDKRKLDKKLFAENMQRTHEEIMESMKAEIAKEKPSMISLKKDLEACRTKRREDARKAISAKDHLKDYPALTYPELIFFEFESVIGLTKAVIKANWVTALPVMMSYFLPEITNLDSLTNDQMTIKILLKLADYFKHNKKVADTCTTRHIVQIFNDGTSVSITEPQADEPPRLIAIGSNDLVNLKFTIYVGQNAMFCGNAIEALIQMFALYWVFNVNYASEAKLAFTFVSSVLFRKKVSKDYQKFKKVWTTLEQLNLF